MTTARSRWWDRLRLHGRRGAYKEVPRGQVAGAVEVATRDAEADAVYVAAFVEGSP